MACGDRYRYLVKTTPSGLTPEEPFGKTWIDEEVKGPFDYHEWKVLADLLVDRAHKAHHKLGYDIEQKRVTAGKLAWSDSKWEALRERNNDLIAAWEGLPNVMFAAPGTAVPEAVQVCLDAVCLLDLCNAAIEAYGDQTEPLPAEKPAEDKGGKFGLGNKLNVGDWINNVVAIGIIGAIAYGAYKLVSMESRSSDGGGD